MANETFEHEGAIPEQKDRAERSGKKLLLIVKRAVLIVLETVLLLAVALYGVMFVVAKGPSDTARDIFVMSVRETSAVGFLANIFFTDDQIAEIESALGDPSIYSKDPARAAALAERLEPAKAELDDAETRWLELSEI